MYLIFIIFVVIIIISQYKKINKPIPENVEILQFNNPDETKYEEFIGSNQPCVFTNVLDNVVLTKKNIQNYFDYYLPNFTMTKSFEILQYNNGHETELKKQTNYRSFIYQIKGTQKIILFAPKEEPYLYLDKTRNFSNINFWNYNGQIYPLFNKSSYLEIVLRPRQMLIIPYNWWYTSKSDTINNSLILKSETVFSKFLKK